MLVSESSAGCLCLNSQACVWILKWIAICSHFCTVRLAKQLAVEKSGVAHRLDRHSFYWWQPARPGIVNLVKNDYINVINYRITWKQVWSACSWGKTWKIWTQGKFGSSYRQYCHVLGEQRRWMLFQNLEMIDFKNTAMNIRIKMIAEMNMNL